MNRYFKIPVYQFVVYFDYKTRMTGYISLSPAGKSLLMDISVCHCHPQDSTNNYVGLNDSVSVD